ncbi:IS200/IS605 family transposase [Enterococcus faecium]|nr:IS200/IS605 family transposase [Enterococcus faecium]
MSEIHYGRGYVYSIQYHLVWCVKYRHDVLYGHVDIDVKQLLKQIADDNNVKIMEMESVKDHNPELKQRLWGGHLWNPSYFVATVSENTEEQIRKYIQNQKKK